MKNLNIKNKDNKISQGRGNSLRNFPSNHYVSLILLTLRFYCLGPQFKCLNSLIIHLFKQIFRASKHDKGYQLMCFPIFFFFLESNFITVRLLITISLDLNGNNLINLLRYPDYSTTTKLAELYYFSCCCD